MKKHNLQNLFSTYLRDIVNLTGSRLNNKAYRVVSQNNNCSLKLVALGSAFFVIFFFNETLASQIQSKKFDSKYVEMHDQEQIESMQKEIQAMNEKIENLEHVIKGMQAKINLSETASKEEKIEAQHQAAEITATEKASNSELNQTKEIPKGLEKQKYDMALSALKSNDIAVASQKFAEFIEEYPKGQFLSNAYFWYGESFYKQKIYDKAALNFLKSYKIAPKGPKASDALFKLASSLKELKKIPDACSMLNKLDEEFSGRPAASIKKADDLRKQMKCK